MPSPYINRTSGIEEARGYVVVDNYYQIAESYLGAIMDMPGMAAQLNVSYLRDMYAKGRVRRDCCDRLQRTIENLNRQVNETG